MVTPLIEGLPVVFHKQDNNIFIFDPDHQEISGKIPQIKNELRTLINDDITGFGLLVRSRSRTKRIQVAAEQTY